MKLKKRFKRLLEMYKTPDPNSPEGLRLRAKWLVEDGTPEKNPRVTSLLKLADLKEKDKT